MYTQTPERGMKEISDLIQIFKKNKKIRRFKPYQVSISKTTEWESDPTKATPCLFVNISFFFEKKNDHDCWDLETDEFLLLFDEKDIDMAQSVHQLLIEQYSGNSRKYSTFSKECSGTQSVSFIDLFDEIAFYKEYDLYRFIGSVKNNVDEDYSFEFDFFDSELNEFDFQKEKSLFPKLKLIDNLK